MKTPLPHQSQGCAGTHRTGPSLTGGGKTLHPRAAQPSLRSLSRQRELQEKHNPKPTTALIPRTGTCQARTAWLRSPEEPALSKHPTRAVPFVCRHSQRCCCGTGNLCKGFPPTPATKTRTKHPEKQQPGSPSARGTAFARPRSSLPRGHHILWQGATPDRSPRHDFNVPARYKRFRKRLGSVAGEEAPGAMQRGFSACWEMHQGGTNTQKREETGDSYLT